METIIPCRNCDHPLKSGSCLGCNVSRLYEALQRGKLNWAKDEYNGIVESKLEQPTLSPDDVRPVVRGKWIAVTNGRGGHECGVCHDYAPSFQDGSERLSNFCPNCGAKMEVSEDG